MAVLLLGKAYLNPIAKRKFNVPIPFEIILVIITTVLSYFLCSSLSIDSIDRLALESAHQVSVVGTIPTGLPVPRAPDLTIAVDYIEDAIAIGLVSMCVSAIRKCLTEHCIECQRRTFCDICHNSIGK